MINAPPTLLLPFAAIPVTESVLFLIQLKLVKGNEEVKAIVSILPPEQIVCVAGVANAIGIGLMEMVANNEFSAEQMPLCTTAL